MSKYSKNPETREIRTGTFHYWATIPARITRPEEAVRVRFAQWLATHNRPHLRVSKVVALGAGQWEITTRKVCPHCGQ